MTTTYTKRQLAVINKNLTECSGCGCSGVHVDDMDGTLISGDVEVTVSSADYTLLSSGREDGSCMDLKLCDECAVKSVAWLRRVRATG